MSLITFRLDILVCERHTKEYDKERDDEATVRACLDCPACDVKFQ